jgi:hypothetical protein
VNALAFRLLPASPFSRKSPLAEWGATPEARAFSRNIHFGLPDSCSVYAQPSSSDPASCIVFSGGHSGSAKRRFRHAGRNQNRQALPFQCIPFDTSPTLMLGRFISLHQPPPSNPSPPAKAAILRAGPHARLASANRKSGPSFGGRYVLISVVFHARWRAPLRMKMIVESGTLPPQRNC